MSIQLSARVRNARLDAIETAMGSGPTMRIRSGAAPANTDAADSGTVLATIALPADWMQNASGASKAMLGTWTDNAADASGSAGHFRIYNAGDNACDLQGTITATGGGGDMTVDNLTFAINQVFSVTAFTLNEPNG